SPMALPRLFAAIIPATAAATAITIVTTSARAAVGANANASGAVRQNALPAVVAKNARRVSMASSHHKSEGSLAPPDGVVYGCASPFPPPSWDGIPARDRLLRWR